MSSAVVPAVGSQVWVERRKWPDAPHYGWTATVLGEDDHGVWVGARPGSTFRAPDGSERQGERPAVWYLPRDGWFLLHLWHGHPEIDIYVDICTPPVWSERGARTVDLDLDVIVWAEPMGGHVELLDEDEFDLHRIALEYPEELVSGARRAAAEVLALVQARMPPFTVESARPWLALLQP